jgi:hypothetical protein
MTLSIWRPRWQLELNMLSTLQLSTKPIIVPPKPFSDSAPSLHVTAIFLMSPAQHWPVCCSSCPCRESGGPAGILSQSQEGLLAYLDMSLHLLLFHYPAATTSPSMSLDLHKPTVAPPYSSVSYVFNRFA